MILDHSIPASPVNANSTAAQVFPQLQTATAPAFLVLRSSGRLEMKKFYVRASGNAVTAVTTNVTISLAAAAVIPATPLTLANWTLLGASTARAQNTANAPWWIELEGIFDSTSGKLHGKFNAMVNNNIDAPAVVSNVITGLAGLATSAEPVLFIVAAITFSAANIGNIGTLASIDLDR